MSEGWKREIEARLAGKEMETARVAFGVALRGWTTLRVGGPAECAVEPETEAQLLALFEVIHSHDLPYFIFGKGSNVLVGDKGLKGVAIRLGKGFRAVHRLKNRRLENEGHRLENEGHRPENTVVCGAGCANARFLEHCRGWGLGGMEFLTAVPGTIGGAIAMNAGAHQGDTAAFLRKVRYFTLGRGIVEQESAAFVFDYRSSPLRGQLGRVVLGGEFALDPLSAEEIRRRITKFQAFRRETQPRDFPNCGSVFKNPSGDFAARLIEQAGLKGKLVGDAQVSEKHANFIVNRGNATAREVLSLIDFIRETVYRLSEIELELELQVL